jgi:hypothetical protein
MIPGLDKLLPGLDMMALVGLLMKQQSGKPIEIGDLRQIIKPEMIAKMPQHSRKASQKWQELDKFMQKRIGVPRIKTWFYSDYSKEGFLQFIGFGRSNKITQPLFHLVLDQENCHFIAQKWAKSSDFDTFFASIIEQFAPKLTADDFTPKDAPRLQS